MVPLVLHCNNGDHTNVHILRWSEILLTVIEISTLIWPVATDGSIISYGNFHPSHIVLILSGSWTFGHPSQLGLYGDHVAVLDGTSYYFS